MKLFIILICLLIPLNCYSAYPDITGIDTFRFNVGAVDMNDSTVVEGYCTWDTTNWWTWTLETYIDEPDGVWCYSYTNYGEAIQKEKYHIAPIVVSGKPLIINNNNRLIIRSSE
jgi:hypothetical protein